jgi:acetyl esterase/lipase
LPAGVHRPREPAEPSAWQEISAATTVAGSAGPHDRATGPSGTVNATILRPLPKERRVPGHPPIDPEIAAVLSAPGMPPASLFPEGIPAGRERSDTTALSPEQMTRGGAISVTERTLAGPADNPQIAALVLTPAAEPGAPARPAGPGILFVHGGGMIMGSRRNLDQTVLDAVELGYTVVSPEYRLAPEHPYPAALEDCYAAWCWVAENAAELGIEPSRLAIAGSSAGGGLAAGVTLLARDRRGPLPARQMLLCPMLDDREITASSTELEGEGRWDRVANRTGWSAYLGDRRGGDDVPVYAAPARAIDLAGLPPTFIDVGDVETFRDEDIVYAIRLSGAGVPVELHVWPGGVHGFTGIAPEAALSRAALAARRDFLRRSMIDR